MIDFGPTDKRTIIANHIALVDRKDEDEELPDVHFGKVTEKTKVKLFDKIKDDDPDDEELSKTPPDVVDLLGFDPKDI